MGVSMKCIGACILTLLLVAGCGNNQSLALREPVAQVAQAPQMLQVDMNSLWNSSASADVSQCQGSMTIAGAIKYKCAQ